MKKLLFCFLILFLGMCGKGQSVTFPADREWGVINISNDTVVPFAYDWVRSYGEELFMARRDSTWLLLDTLGNVLYLSPNQMLEPFAPIVFLDQGTFGTKRDSIINAGGIHGFPANRLKIVAQNKRRESRKVGVVSTSGKEIVPRIYDHIEVHWHDKSFLVTLDGKMGMLDSVGKQVIPIVYDELETYSEKLLLAKIDERWGIIDLDNQVHLPFHYKSLWVNHCNRKQLIVKNEQGYTGMINIDNKQIIPCQYGSLSLFSPDLLYASKDEQFGLINYQNEVVIPLQYEEEMIGNTMFLCNDNSAQYFYAVKNGKKGLLNLKGEVTIPLIYDELSFLSDDHDYFSITIGEKYGVVDKHGRIIIPARYDYIRYEENNVFEVTLYEEDDIFSGKCGIVDNRNKTIVPIRYDYVTTVSENGNLLYYLVVIDMKHGILSPTGNTLVPMIYDAISMYDRGGTTCLVVKKDDKVGIIDLDNNIVLPFHYQDILCDWGYLKVQKDGKWGLMSMQSLEMLLPCEYDRVEKLHMDYDGFGV